MNRIPHACRNVIFLLRNVLFLSLLLSPSSLFSQDEPDITKFSGTEIYTSFCSRCHGMDGKGQIPQEMIDNMEAPPPDLTDPYFASREKRADWQAVVREGGPVRGLSSAMPAWGAAISDKQITEVVDHMKSFVDQSLYPQGETNFFRSHLVTKAFVEQEFLVIPTISSTAGVTEAETVLYYANRFGNRFQYEAKIPVVVGSAPGATHTGLGDLEVGLKYCVFDDHLAKQIFSVGIESAVPTGNRTLGLSNKEVFANLYMAGGMQFGDILQAQASVKFEAPAATYFENLEIKSAVAATAIFSESKQGFFPGIEVLHIYEKAAGESFVYLLPKLYWGITTKGHLALSVGPELQISGPKTFDTRWRAFFLWDYVDGGLWW